MEKINVSELLKDCPKGMELDCTIYENVCFGGLSEDKSDEYPITVNIIDGNNNKHTAYLTKEGCWSSHLHAKCVIFPKGKTSWEGFLPLCKFKDGDILTTNIGSIFIFSHLELDRIDDRNICKAYVGIRNTMPISLFHTEQSDIFGPYESLCKLATEEEKEKLFQAIKDNGYKWNPENKTLEKLNEPKFKVGDRIKLNNCSSIYTITDLLEDKYRATVHSYDLYEIKFERQDAYQLVPNKFDITTLVPFESRVLVRDYDTQIWIPAFWGKHLKDGSNCSYLTTNGCYKHCIPYERNEHLIGKTDDCDEHFKTWE